MLAQGPPRGGGGREPPDSGCQMERSTAVAVAAGAAAVAAAALLQRYLSQRDRLACILSELSLELDGHDLHRHLATAVPLALQCGKNMLRCERSRTKFKDGAIDPVTETDEANEALVKQGLLKAFPDHTLIGEEACEAAGAIPALGKGPTW